MATTIAAPWSRTRCIRTPKDGQKRGSDGSNPARQPRIAAEGERLPDVARGRFVVGAPGWLEDGTGAVRSRCRAGRDRRTPQRLRHRAQVPARATARPSHGTGQDGRERGQGPAGRARPHRRRASWAPATPPEPPALRSHPAVATCPARSAVIPTLVRSRTSSAVDWSPAREASSLPSSTDPCGHAVTTANTFGARGPICAASHRECAARHPPSRRSVAMRDRLPDPSPAPRHAP